MPRWKTVPAYRLHKASGRTVVTLNGRDFYLGLHGSQTSKDAYDRLIAENLAAGRRVADVTAAPLSVAELALAYVNASECQGSHEPELKALNRLGVQLGVSKSCGGEIYLAR